MSLFLGNIPKNINNQLLVAEFSKFGPCTVSFNVIKTQGKFAFIDYSNEILAKQVFLSPSLPFKGQLQIRLQEHAPLLPPKPQSSSIIISPKILPTPEPKPIISERISSKSHSSPDWVLADNEETQLFPPQQSKLRPLPIPRNKRGRKKAGEDPAAPIVFIDHDTVAAYGNLFKVKTLSKKDGNSILKCEICNRKFKKKSVRSHVISKLHQSFHDHKTN